VKRPLSRNFWKKLAAVVGPSRTLRSWKMANRLRNRDLPVAQPLAVLERYALGLIRTDSIGISEYVDGASDLETFLTRDVAALPAGRRRLVKDRVIESVVRLLKAFHERGFVHRDMKAPNLMVRWAPPYRGSPVLIFIDMDGIKHVRRVRDAQRCGHRAASA
jgi:serine/threonine protein kinase